MRNKKIETIFQNALKMKAYDSLYNPDQTFEELPVINKNIYHQLTKKNPLNISSNTFVLRNRVNIDGEESLFPLSGADYRNFLLMEKRKFELCGVKKNDRCCIVGMSQDFTAAMIAALQLLNVNYFPLVNSDEQKFFDDVVRYKITTILIIPQILNRLIDYIKNGKLTTSLKIVITTGSKVLDIESLSTSVKQILGAELFDTIGSSELGTFAISCKEHKDYYHFIDGGQIAEIIDPEKKLPSKKGEIVITPLWRVDYPLLRYGTSDYTSVNTRLKCHCPVQNKTFFHGIEKRLVEETRIERYLVDLNSFYDVINNSLLWQNYFFDKRLWNFIERPLMIALISRLHGQDTPLIFIEKMKFHLTLRRRQDVLKTIFKVSNANGKIILCDKHLLKNISPLCQDIRNIKANKLPKEIKKLLKLY